MCTLLMLLSWVAGMMLLPAMPFVGAALMWAAYKLGKAAARDEDQFIGAMMALGAISFAVEWAVWLFT